jgi:hypothetical protein
MQHTNFSKSNSLTNKVKINLNMFGTLVLDWIGGEVNSTDVVTIDDGGSAERAAKLTK